MAQDPKKEAQEVERISLKDKLKQVSSEKKAPLKKATEMGKPSLMPKFEAAMQKERDFVLNRAKQREEAEMGGKAKPKLLKSMSKGSMKMERY
jgi:hypothetical protein